METTEKKHALLSPSAAHRWLECTPSAVAESAYADEGSAYALEGSLAHAVAALEVLTRAGKAETPQAKACLQEIEALAPLVEGEVSDEMREHARDYATRVMATYKAETGDADRADRVELHVETSLDLDDWAHGSHGTADIIIVGERRITVIDFKYGRGVRVSAEGNPQMRMYALGALSEFGVERGIEEICMQIIQPRLNAYSTDLMTVDELEEWGLEVLHPLSEMARRGLGRRSAGEWCRFCKDKVACPELDGIAAQAATLQLDRQDARSLGQTCLPMIPALEIWIETARRNAMTMMLQGTDVPGFKMVRKRSLRRISDPATAINLLRGAGYTDEQFLKPGTLKGLGDLEKLVGKKEFAELCGPLIVKPEGELTIAPDNDKRPTENGGGYFAGISI